MPTLPRRVYNSPLIAYTNFTDGNHINLIRLIKPYANGASYAVSNTIDSSTNKLYSTYEKAKKQFNILSTQHHTSPLRNEGTIPSNY